MNPAKLSIIALTGVCAIALAACTEEEKALVNAALTGKYVPTAAELSQYSAIIAAHEAGTLVPVEPSSSVSSEPVVTVAVVPEVVPEPPPLVAYEVCEPYLWRGEMVPNCHWEWR